MTEGKGSDPSGQDSVQKVRPPVTKNRGKEGRERNFEGKRSMCKRAYSVFGGISDREIKSRLLGGESAVEEKDKGKDRVWGLRSIKDTIRPRRSKTPRNGR